MKKKFLVLLTILASFVSAYAGNGISVGAVSVPQGGTGTIDIELNNDDYEFTAFTFKLTLPEGLSFVLNASGKPTFEKSTRFDDSHTVTSAVSGQVGSFGCLSGDKAAIKGKSGVLLKVYVKADAGLSVGKELTATLSELTFTTTSVTEVPFANVTAEITIDEARVLLDENSTAAPEASGGPVDVRVKRTIKANEWSTICLPFDMSTAQLDAAFGEMGTGWMLADFQGYETSEDDEENIVGISINFAKVTALEANHPYLIKVSEAVSSFTVDGVEIDPEEEPTVAAVKRTKKQWSEFIGTYQAQTVVDEQMLFLNGNKFYYSNGNTKMKAFRGYFDFYDVLSEVENANSRVLLVWDGQATTIAEIDAPNVLKGAVYNLNGQFMGTDVDLKSLPQGVYTVDGKKVVNY